MSLLCHGVLATVHLDSDTPGARKRGVFDGYHPDHQFEWADVLTGGLHYYCDDAEHLPGETADVMIIFPFWSHFGDRVSVGDKFGIYEGSRLVGTGSVLGFVETGALP